MQILLLGENEKMRHPQISKLHDAPEDIQSDSVYERMYAEQRRKQEEKGNSFFEAERESNKGNHFNQHNVDEEDEIEGGSSVKRSEEDESKKAIEKRTSSKRTWYIIFLSFSKLPCLFFCILGQAEEEALRKREWNDKEQKESIKVRAEANILLSTLMSYDTKVVELAQKGPLAVPIPHAQDPQRDKKLDKFHSWFSATKNEQMRNNVQRREMLAALRDELVREACKEAGLNVSFSKNFDWNNVVVEECPPPEFDMAEAFGSWVDDNSDSLKGGAGSSSSLEPKRKSHKEQELERAKIFMYWYFSSAAGQARLDFLERRSYITDRATLKLERWRAEGGADEGSEDINVFSVELDELVFGDDIEWLDLPEEERLMEAEAAICDVKVREAAQNSGVELITLAEISYFLFGSMKADTQLESPLSRDEYERKFNAFLDWFPSSKARKLFLKREMEAG